MALTDKLKHADKLKAELNALLPMSADNEKRWWEKVRLDWNYNSNHIEGNTLTYGETQLLLIFDKTTGDHDLREYEEMTAHDIAIKLVKEWSKDRGRDLTERDIRELNKIILVKNYWKDAITPDGQPTKKEIKVGEYKETPNSVKLKSGGEFEFASPLETPQKMAELIQWYRNENKLHPLVLASKFHYDFIRIHPFDDGNGRVARLIVNYVLMKDDFPPLIIKSEERDKYITALNKADVGDIDAFHEYMADQLIHALELAIKASKSEDINEPDDLDKKITLFERDFDSIDTGEDLKEQFNKDVFFKIYDGWLSELLMGLIEKIKKFDKFFAKPSHFITAKTMAIERQHSTSVVSINFDNKSSSEIVKELRAKIENLTVASDTIIDLTALYGAFKKGVLKNPFGCTYHVEIIFEFLKYEIFRNKFIPGMKHYVNLSQDIITTVLNNPNIRTAYFDANGAFHINVHPENGKLYTSGTHNEILAQYSREDVLDGAVTYIGTERYLKPRLLHQPLTLPEIETLCNEFGETIFNHIKYYAEPILKDANKK